MIEGASRSFLAQVTRHRMASYTSGSQHYQNYRNYGTRIKDGLTAKQEWLITDILDQSMEGYRTLIDNGVPAQEARQVLPNAMENNLMMTINARSLINFFNLRLCSRNTDEMFTVASKMYELALEDLPSLFEHVGPDCKMSKCTQGKMRCKDER